MWIFQILFTLAMAYLVYRRAKKNGLWDWKMFFQVIGSMLVFVGLLVVPLAYTNIVSTHPVLFVSLLFAGIAGYMWWLVVFSKSMMTELRRRQALAATGEQGQATG